MKAAKNNALAKKGMVIFTPQPSNSQIHIEGVAIFCGKVWTNSTEYLNLITLTIQSVNLTRSWTQLHSTRLLSVILVTYNALS